MGVTNRRPSSDSELISRMEMRLLACMTRGPSRDPYQTVSTVFHIKYFENRPLEPGARFSKVPIINGPGKPSPFILKIEVSKVLHLA